MEMFEYAVRNKLRFSYKGQIGVEDLFDLSVRELDSIFKSLNAKAKQSEEESLLNVKSKEDETLAIQIDIIKYIVGSKLAEEEARSNARAVKEQKQKLLAIKAAKQEEALKNLSVEEIDKMLNELG